MKHLTIITILMSLLLPVLASPVQAEMKPVIKSTVRDINGKPVSGAYIFFYDSPDTKRAVDLVSPVTDKNGFCKKEIPPGSYWILARLKREGDFDMGPLMIEDKVSADPLEITVKPGDKRDLDFTVMSLLDTIRTQTKKRKDLNKVSGRIVNEEGEAVKKAFVFANRHDRAVTMPRYFSAWTGEEGHFSIFLPKGKYYLGATTSFAPDQKYAAGTEIIVKENVGNQEIVLPSINK